MATKTAAKGASLLLGTILGFLLVGVGATTYNNHAEMFLFQNFTLVIVIAMAMITGIIGVAMIKRMKPVSLIELTNINMAMNAFQKRLVLGALLFGTGWAMTASCPGTALAMLGEGKLSGLTVAGGIMIGTLLYGYLAAKYDGRKG